MDFTDRLIRDFKTTVRRASDARPVVHKAFESKPLDITAAPPPPVYEAPPRAELSRPRAKRAEDILRVAAASALSSLQKHRTLSMQQAFEAAVLAHSKQIIEASKVDTQRLEEERQKARTSLAEDLRGARKRLRDLRKRAGRAGEEAAQAVALHEQHLRLELSRRMSAARAAAMTDLKALAPTHAVDLQALIDGYESVPAPTITPHKEGQGLPEESGVYFLWDGGIVDYVGRANRLCARLKLGSHHVLKDGHRISYILMPRRELTWAECYYIGITRPKQNFGRHATHRDEK